ncbi:hypothetical protein E2C01_079365 [Portunus trituberculatus]|uniref:Secreted protein n=1 Tax=Portunus trituberculatus TaxID=210409 RepID=A0A5B7IJD7_PORTR|nr:hypothetical protein [Portunus trituberculatus]
MVMVVVVVVVVPLIHPTGPTPTQPYNPPTIHTHKVHPFTPSSRLHNSTRGSSKATETVERVSIIRPKPQRVQWKETRQHSNGR